MLNFRPAQGSDFAPITAIYNQAITKGNITADLEIESIEQRADVLGFHLQQPQYPLIVVEEDQQVVGYGYLSPYNSRPGYYHTAEISYYLDMNCRGHGLGSQMLEHLIALAQEQQYHALVGITFANNAASNHLLLKYGFQLWGELPDVAVNACEEPLTQQFYGRTI